MGFCIDYRRCERQRNNPATLKSMDCFAYGSQRRYIVSANTIKSMYLNELNTSGIKGPAPDLYPTD